MLWILFMIWVIFSITYTVLVDVYKYEVFGFLFLISLPIMFYLPFMVRLF